MKPLKLSIIVPVYNEQKTIQTVLERLEEVQLPIEKEIVIVDDYSTDGTKEILKPLEQKYVVVYHEKSKGKGLALRTGFAKATGDIITVHWGIPCEIITARQASALYKYTLQSIGLANQKI